MTETMKEIHHQFEIPIIDDELLNPCASCPLMIRGAGKPLCGRRRGLQCCRRSRSK